MGKNNSLIAIDYGTKKSGLAYSVEGFCFAYKTIASKELFVFLPDWIKDRKANMVVVGLPLNIDGSESAHSKRVRTFGKELQKMIDIPIVLHDEGLTTSEALLGLEGYDHGDIDAESARLILEEYIKTLSIL